jgi:hypothetical protein
VIVPTAHSGGFCANKGRDVSSVQGWSRSILYEITAMFPLTRSSDLVHLITTLSVSDELIVPDLGSDATICRE